MQKRSYHHGNLRQALVDSALELIEETGPQTFTIAQAAKRVGVSAAAPYRHFGSRQELLIEAARQGFEIFADLLEFAYNKGQPSALSAFERTSLSYLAFARHHPSHYIVMFESGISVNASPELAQAANRAKDVVQEASRKVVAHLPPERMPPVAMVCDHIWAISHGVVELFARGPVGSRSPYTPEDLLESGIGIYLRGLGLVAPDS
ncbi:MAG: TetR/AcrR family transcriptional regulator [Rhodobacteraceae bacterium]|nr:TetR/AcrR family transcriptional regulator [Paracoccaceae bacterium]MCY4197452.1 TetR/AcrR family transcriptional regulator [Paracoccaceae bacterium]